MTQSLNEWFSQLGPSQFPTRIDYIKRYAAVADYLDKEVHPHVGRDALERGGYLTDHGAEHIAVVIKRISALLSHDFARLSPYEAYLVLMAAHFHDVGNIYGRKGHEKRIGEIMAHLGSLIGDDAAEKRAIIAIAGAHGGSIGHDRDTIGKLPVDEPVLGQTVRMQLLAALLRFADELADESSRAARFQLVLGNVPGSSELHHEYARHLHSVIIRPESHSIELRFEMTSTVATRQFGTDKHQSFLLDEIFRRTLKTHVERLYCMRFLAATARFDSVSVRVDVFLSDQHTSPVATVGYRLQETGYPDSRRLDIRRMCPEIDFSGQSLSRMLAKRRTAKKARVARKPRIVRKRK